MSLNELFQDTYKPWLNCYFNTLEVDGNLQLNNITGSPGDYLQIIGGVAAWGAAPSNITGNEFASLIGGITPASFNSYYTPTLVQELIPYNTALYDFTRGNTYVTILENGLYYIYVKVSNLIYTSNLFASIQIIIGSSVTTLSQFSGKSLSSTQIGASNDCVLCTGVATASAGDKFQIQLQANGSSATIGNRTSSVGILKVG